MTETFEIKQGRRITTITGELLCDVSSETPEKIQWTQYQIFRTSSGKYVVVTYGVSRLSKQRKKIKIDKDLEPDDVVDALMFNSREGKIYLTKIGETALEAAAEKDERLNDVYLRDDIT